MEIYFLIENRYFANISISKVGDINKISCLKDKNHHDTVEIGSDSEIKWVSHLLGLSEHSLRQKLTHKVTEARDEKVLTPFHIDQALDAR